MERQYFIRILNKSDMLAVKSNLLRLKREMERESGKITDERDNLSLSEYIGFLAYQASSSILSIVYLFIFIAVIYTVVAEHKLAVLMTVLLSSVIGCLFLIRRESIAMSLKFPTVIRMTTAGINYRIKCFFKRIRGN